HAQSKGTGKHVLGHGARPRDARGGGALSRPQQERDPGEPGAQGVLARVPRRDRQDQAGPRGKSGRRDMKVKWIACVIGLAASVAVQAQNIKIGELNSYKVFPAFLEPYKKGMELALEEINAAGGVNGRKL